MAVRNGTIRFALTIIAGVLVAVCPGRVALRAQDSAAELRSQFSGEWRLNPELSTDREQLNGDGRGSRDTPPGRRGGGFGGGRGAVGGRGGIGGGSGGRGNVDPEQMRAQMQEARALLTDAPQSFVLTYAEPKFAIALPDGRTRTVYTDKRKAKANNGNADVQARWDNDRVVVETTLGTIKVVETFAVSRDSQQLVHTAKLELQDGDRGGRGGGRSELRRVYDRVTGDGAGFR